MSFVVKGWTHDGNCLNCYFQSEDTDRCLLTDEDIPLYGKGHPASCPIIPLPEKHGRLIDADVFEDAFIRHYLEQERKGNLMFAAVEIKQQLADMIGDWPTIIEAEGEK